MLAWPERRPLAALTGAAIFVLMGQMGVYQLSLGQALAAVDFNVLLMIAGTMGTVSLFIESKMPLRLAEQLIRHVPDVRGAVTVLALFAGVISAFVDNVATVLMIGTGGPGHCPAAVHLAGAGADRHCGFLQPAGRRHHGG